MVRETYPQMTMEKQFKTGQEMWNQVKNDPEKYDKTVLNLKPTAAKEKNKNAKLWMNFVSLPKKKQTVQTDVVEIVQPDKSKFYFSFLFVSPMQYTPKRTTKVIMNNSYKKIKKEMRNILRIFEISLEFFFFFKP